MLAFCHSLLKFEPQNARLRTSSGFLYEHESDGAVPARGASQLPGVRRGNGGESALGLGVMMLSSSSFGGGRVSFRVGCDDVVVVFFWGAGGESALELCVMMSSSSAGNGGESASGLRVMRSSSSAGNGGESASGVRRGNGDESALELCVMMSSPSSAGNGGGAASGV